MIYPGYPLTFSWIFREYLAIYSYNSGYIEDSMIYPGYPLTLSYLGDNLLPIYMIVDIYIYMYIHI